MQSQAEVKIGDQEVKHAQQSEFVSFTVAYTYLNSSLVYMF